MGAPPNGPPKFHRSQKISARTSFSLSRASTLNAIPSLHLHRGSRPLYLYTFTSARLQRTSRALELHTSTCSRLQRPLHLCLHVATHASSLQTSGHSYVYTLTLRALELCTSILPRPNVGSTPPALHTSLPPHSHVCTAAAPLLKAIPPRSNTSIEPLDPNTYTSSSRHLQIASRAGDFLHASTFTRLQRIASAPYLSTRTPPYNHGATSAALFQSSKAPELLHICTPSARLLHAFSAPPGLQSSIPP